MRKLLVVGSLRDRTTSYLVNRLLAIQQPFDYIDLARTILQGVYRFEEQSVRILVGGQEFVTSNYDGIFYQYIPLQTANVCKDLADRADNFLRSWHQYLRYTSLVVASRPQANFHNYSKLLHLIHLCRVLNLSQRGPIAAPEIIVSNDAISLRNFAEIHGHDVITKGVSGVKTWAIGLSRQQISERLQHLSGTPVLLQRRIHGWDCRIHVIGEATVAERIKFSGVDYRRSKVVNYESIQLPANISGASVMLEKRLDCDLLGIDFKVTSEGKWYLLEANSMPCFEGYDRRSNGRIVLEFIDLLKHRSTAGLSPS